MKIIFIGILLFGLNFCSSPQQSANPSSSANDVPDKSIVEVIQEKAASEEGQQMIQKIKEKAQDKETQEKVKSLFQKKDKKENKNPF